MLTILESNRLEALAGELGRALSLPTQSPLEPRIVVVPNAGIARWLWLSLAAQRGISANLDCVLPGSFVWRVFHCVLDDVAQSSPYDPQVMLWRLHALLREAHGDARLAGLGEWRDTDDDRRRFELAGALARQFDQYIVYRPDLVRRWRRGGGEGPETWQAELWRRLSAATAAPDWSVLRARLEQVDPARVRAALPARVSVFGIPLLSPGYLDVLSWLARNIDVTLYVPNPCREHWAQIVPERDLGRRAGVEDERALYLETGNALLASWGGQVRELIDLLHEQEPLVVEERFVDPGADSLLHTLQRQILLLREPARDGDGPARVATTDRSVQVHVCHSPRREVEVLHDQLLGLFDADPQLSAADVLVLTPDIDKHAPYIDAVFRGGPIAYRIADRDLRRGVVVVEAFLALLGLPAERFDANDVLAVLETAPVQRRFGLAGADIVRIREWARDTGIRRDLGDAAGPAPGSWRHGLDRMLLGFALPGELEGVYAGVSPYDEIEGTDAVVLGALAEFVDRLAGLARATQTAQTPAQWAQWLRRSLDAFFEAGDGDEQDFQALREVFNELEATARRAAFDEPVAFVLVRDWLSEALGAAQPSGGFLGHGVTFASLVAMRNVPARVLCLLGLDDGVFPRARRRASFDLIARHPRRGDRSRRDDDRLAFLESLLNARDVFYLSYVGRDVRDDNPSPPAVPVSELLEYCERNFATASGAPADLVVRHPLHPFSRRYFDGSDPKLFSYSSERCAAAAAAATGAPPPFVDGALADAAPAAEIELETLQGFYANPSKAFLRERLQLAYGEEAEPLDTADPLLGTNLERWQLGERLVELLLGGHDIDAALEIAGQSRYAAPGPLGQVIMRERLEHTSAFVSGLREHLPDAPLAPVPVVVRAGAHTISATLQPVDCVGLYLWRQGRTRASDRLRAWLAHLVLCVAGPEGIAKRTHWYASEGSFALREVDGAAGLLTELVELYLAGLRQPLPFVAGAAWQYCETLDRRRDEAQAQREAQKKFVGELRYDDYLRRAVGTAIDPAELADLATRIFGPLRQHLVEAQS